MNFEYSKFKYLLNQSNFKVELEFLLTKCLKHAAPIHQKQIRIVLQSAFLDKVLFVSQVESQCIFKLSFLWDGQEK